jgi:WD40 repeat protein
VRSDRLRLLALSQTSISRDPGRAFDDALIGAGPAEAGSLDAEHATEARTAAGAVLSACYEEARYPIDNYATSCGASINGSLFAASDGGSEDLRFAASAKDVFDSIPLPVEGGVSAAAFVGPDAIVAAILPKFAAQAGRSVAVFDVRRRTWGESRSIEDVPRVKYVEGDPRRNRVFVSGDDGRFAFGRLDDVGEFVVVGGAGGGLVESRDISDWTPLCAFAAASSRFVLATSPTTILVGEYDGNEPPRKTTVITFDVQGLLRIAVGPDGREVWALTSGGRLMTWSVADDGAIMRRADVDVRPPAADATSRAIVRAALDPGRRRVALATDGDIRLFTVFDSSVVEEARLVGHVKPPRALEFSPDGSRVLSGGQEDETQTIEESSSFRVWRTENPFAAHRLFPRSGVSFREAAFSRYGLLVVGIEESPTTRSRRVRLWNASRRSAPVFEDCAEDAIGCEPLCATFDPSGERVVVGLANGEVVIRKTAPEVAGEIEGRWTVAGGVECVDFSFDGRLVAAGSRNGVVEVREPLAPERPLFAAPIRPYRCTFVSLRALPGELVAGYDDPRSSLVAFRLDDPSAAPRRLYPHEGVEPFTPRALFQRCEPGFVGVLSGGYPVLCGFPPDAGVFDMRGLGGAIVPFAAFVRAEGDAEAPVLWACTNESSGGHYAWSTNTRRFAPYERRGVVTTALGVSNDGTQMAFGLESGEVEIGGFALRGGRVEYELRHRVEVSRDSPVVLAAFSNEPERTKRMIGFVARDGTAMVSPFDPIGEVRARGLVSRRRGGRRD